MERLGRLFGCWTELCPGANTKSHRSAMRLKKYVKHGGGNLSGRDAPASCRGVYVGNVCGTRNAKHLALSCAQKCFLVSRCPQLFGSARVMARVLGRLEICFVIHLVSQRRNDLEHLKKIRFRLGRY